MEYTPENIDIEAFEEALLQKRNFHQQLMQAEIDHARSYFSGYEKCVFDVIDMLHCSNYEKRNAE